MSREQAARLIEDAPGGSAPTCATVLPSELRGSVYGCVVEHDRQEMEEVPLMGRAVPNRDDVRHLEGVTGVARMARISVRSGSLKRSVTGWIPLNQPV
jgi:hypothetical protein